MRIQISLISRGNQKKSNKMEVRFLFYCKKSQSSNNMCIPKLYRKNVNFSQPYEISGDFEKDLKKFKSFFKGIKGKVAEYS